VLALAASVGCASATGFTPFPQSHDVSLGRSAAKEVERKLPVEKDPFATAGIARIGKEILAANSIHDYEFVFRVIRDDRTVNAFALPGGKIYVYTGLIARAGDEAEVAGVLAHEIAHVTERHSSERLTDGVGVSVLESILLGRLGSVVHPAAEAVNKVGFLAYSRHQEAEADEVGLGYLTHTRYDPNGIVRFFRKIAALGKSGSNAVTSFLSDHPDPEDRIKDAEARIEELPPSRRTGETYEERWLAYRERVTPAHPKAAQ
jgi:predicted Zn-dependent protease